MIQLENDKIFPCSKIENIYKKLMEIEFFIDMLEMIDSYFSNDSQNYMHENFFAFLQQRLLVPNILISLEALFSGEEGIDSYSKSKNSDINNEIIAFEPLSKLYGPLKKWRNAIAHSNSLKNYQNITAKFDEIREAIIKCKQELANGLQLNINDSSAYILVRNEFKNLLEKN